MRIFSGAGFQVVSPLDIAEEGINKTIDKIRRKNTSMKYVSIDLDCLDPAFAPGVSVPTPCGLTSVELTCLVKHAVSSGIVGMDIVELCPKYDINDMTASLGCEIAFRIRGFHEIRVFELILRNILWK